MGAIEIYNKPRFSYRDEVFVILIMNAWELLLKAGVSKHRKSIYYRKKRGEPYRTVSWADAAKRLRAAGAWPQDIPFEPVRENLRHLGLYRDNAVHYYNADGFGLLVYLMAQTAIVNYRDVLKALFGDDLSDEMTWTLLPLGTSAPSNALDLLNGKTSGEPVSGAVAEFLASIHTASEGYSADELARLITVFDVKLESVKRIERADFVVGVDGAAQGNEPVFIERTLDPTKTHPYLPKRLVEEVAARRDDKFTSYDYQAIAFANSMRGERRLHYSEDDTQTQRWSPEARDLMVSMSRDEIDRARALYKAHLQSRRGR